MKSIPSLKRGTSLSLIISHKAFVTVVFKLGSCFSIISFCSFLSNDIISSYFFIFATRYFIPLFLRCLHLNSNIQYTPKKLRSSIFTKLSKLLYICLLVSSLLSSNPGIRLLSNPGKHIFNSIIFNLTNIPLTILSKNFCLLVIVALGKKGNNPEAYMCKLSINLSLYLVTIFFNKISYTSIVISCKPPGHSGFKH